MDTGQAEQAAVHKTTTEQRPSPLAGGLLSEQHVAYCLALNDLVNPRGEPKRVAYNGMGPDVASVLLATDATEIYGFDINPLNEERLRECLDRWDDLENVQAFPYQNGLRRSTNLDIISFVLDGLVNEGYWYQDVLHHMGVERALLIECKRLGVQQDYITISNTEGRIRMTFPWSSPNGNMRTRSIEYIPQAFSLYPEDQLPDVDVFYQKSLPISQSEFETTVSRATRKVGPGGMLLLGARDQQYSLSDVQTQEAGVIEQIQTMGQIPRQLSVDPLHTQALHDVYDSKIYGWHMQVVQIQ